MENFNQLGRIDRAIAENLSDIRVGFGDYSALALDFVVFISQRIKYDLFGYTRFTLSDFCKATGRHRSDLSRKLPQAYLKKYPPHSVDGYKFDTIFEHLLIQLMKTNILFSETYEERSKERTVEIAAIRIVSDVKLNFSRLPNEPKIFDVRLSPEILDGFFRRYYTIDSDSYRLVGSGRGRERRQTVVVYLSMLRHILLSKNNYTTTIALENFVSQMDIADQEPFRQKETVKRVLTYIRDKASFPFDWEFVNQGTGYQYFIRLTFHPVYSKSTLVKEHHFYYGLKGDLKLLYDTRHGINKPKEHFQAWLTNKNEDAYDKLSILKKVYSRYFSINLTDKQSLILYTKGFVKK